VFAVRYNCGRAHILDTKRIVAALALDATALHVELSTMTESEANAVGVIAAWRLSLILVNTMQVAHSRLRRRIHRRRAHPAIQSAADALSEIVGRTRPKDPVVTLAASLRHDAGLSHYEVAQLLEVLGYDARHPNGREDRRHKARMRAKRRAR
jgi:hypothetical protein